MEEVTCKVCGCAPEECQRRQRADRWQAERHEMWRTREADVARKARPRISHLSPQAAARVMQDMRMPPAEVAQELNAMGPEGRPPLRYVVGDWMRKKEARERPFNLLGALDNLLAQDGCRHGFAHHILGAPINGLDLFGFQSIQPDREEHIIWDVQ